MADERTRIEDLIRRVNALAASVQRAEGRLLAEEKNYAALQQECRAEGLDPDNIDSSIASLQAELQSALAEAEAQVSAAERAVAPFLNA